MSTTINKFIGSGIVFPIEINTLGRPDYHNDIKLIRASILNILNWPQRIRFFNEKFGCRIEEVLEEPDDAVSQSLIRHFVRDSIDLWEKRVELIDIEIDGDTPTVIKLKILYRIRETKHEESFIFPFYKQISY